METYEIHNREVLLKAMETCAGPECGAACPYKDKGRGGKSCRTVLLEDAMAALVKDKGDLDERNALSRECAALTVENKTLHERCQVQQNEINALLLKAGKTDRTSVSDDALKNEYKRGYLDAMEYCFRELCKRAGGGCCHE